MPGFGSTTFRPFENLPSNFWNSSEQLLKFFRATFRILPATFSDSSGAQAWSFRALRLEAILVRPHDDAGTDFSRVENQVTSLHAWRNHGPELQLTLNFGGFVKFSFFQLFSKLNFLKKVELHFAITFSDDVLRS